MNRINNDSQLKIESQLIEWIQKESGISTNIDSKSDLVNERILDSIQFLSLILFVEQLLGEIIPEEEISIENFNSIEKIYNNFFLNKLR